MSPKSRPGTKEKVLDSLLWLANLYEDTGFFMYLKEFGNLTEEEKRMVKEWEETAKTVYDKKTKEEIEEFVRNALRHHRETKHDSEK